MLEWHEPVFDNSGLEWHEPVFDNSGLVIDPKTGRQQKRRDRVSLAAEGVTTRVEAVARAEELAAKFADLSALKAKPEPSQAKDASEVPEVVTLGFLLDLYFKEAVPNKKADTQKQNDTDRRMFLAYFGRDAVVERIGPKGRPVTEMGRVRYNDFIRARLEGTIPGFAKAKGQTIRNDVRFLRAVFKWGQAGAQRRHGAADPQSVGRVPRPALRHARAAGDDPGATRATGRERA